MGGLSNIARLPGEVMDEFSVGQRVTLDLLEKAFGAAHSVFDTLDRKAQELLNFGALILGVVAVSSAVRSGPLSQSYMITLFGGLLAFFLLALIVMWARSLQAIPQSPMLPQRNVALAWSSLSSDNLWKKLVVQYSRATEVLEESIQKKTRIVRIAETALAVELFCITISVLVPT